MEKLTENQTFAEYQLLRRLGAGGMSEVWLARPLRKLPKHPLVVVKRVQCDREDLPLVSLFRDEVRVARLLDHPNVVRMLDAGQVGDSQFMVMELIDGLDLRACLAAHGGPLWPPLAALVVAEGCAGLHYAHTLRDEDDAPLRLVHRDLAPDNLMLDVKGEVRLVDFGIARSATSEVTTKAGFRKGKVRYMAPEYLRGEDANVRTDVYGMGATLLELCTGQKPFGHLNQLPQVMQAITKEGLPSASTLRPSLPKALVDVISRATAMDPKRRLQNARQLEDLLRDFLAENPPHDASEIGEEVQAWKAKGLPATPDSRTGGTLGQLESTEVVHSHHAPGLPPLPELGDEAFSAPTVRQPAAVPKVMVSPDLEAETERFVPATVPRKPR